MCLPFTGSLHERGNRFRFENTDYAENMKAVREIVELIRAKSSKDVKIILTVSPVPLNRTFSDQDIIVANSYSKIDPASCSTGNSEPVLTMLITSPVMKS